MNLINHGIKVLNKLKKDYLIKITNFKSRIKDLPGLKQTLSEIFANKCFFWMPKSFFFKTWTLLCQTKMFQSSVWHQRVKFSLWQCAICTGPFASAAKSKLGSGTLLRIATRTKFTKIPAEVWIASLQMALVKNVCCFASPKPNPVANLTHPFQIIFFGGKKEMERFTLNLDK